MTEVPAAARSGADPIGGKTWFGHPRGLTILFLTETWTMFSFFGMRAMLVYYMTKQLLFTQDHSSIVYGLYTGFVFFTPILGGIIADRFLGRRRAVIAGGIIMAAGHFMMAFEPLFYAALGAIVIGNGLFLPSLPSQIKQLYAADDRRRSSAYNVYYVGINLGAFVAPFICGTIGELYGWHYGFAIAGLGMLTGLVIYLAGSKYLPRDEGRPAEVDAQIAADTRAGGANAYVLLALIAATVVIFRAAYEQAGNTLALWVDGGIDRAVGGFTIPMTWVQSLNPLLIFLLTPVILVFWSARARRGHEQTAVAKMATGGFIVAISYAMLALVSYLADPAHPPSWLWVVAFFLIYTIGELFILPVGLGLFGRLAPHRSAATMIAAWFLAAFFGNLLAGAVGTLWSGLSPDEFFLLIAGMSAASGTFLLLLVPWSRRLEAVSTSSGKPTV